LNKILKYVLPLVILASAFFIGQYYSSFRKSFTPRHWVADLQYTHLAITENFENGKSTLFHPYSFNLDPDGGASNQIFDGTCDARFPIIHLLIAKVSKGQKAQINTWRQVSRIFFCVSFLFIYLLLYQITKNYIISFISTFGLGITTLLLYAQDSIGTYTFTFSLIIAAFYFYHLFSEQEKKWQFYVSFILIGLASLTGHGTVLILMTLSFFYFKNHLYRKSDQKDKLIYFTLLTLFLVLFLYQRVYLLNLNGGVFELHGAIKGGMSSIIRLKVIFMTSIANLLSNTYIAASIFLGFIFYLFMKYKKIISDKKLDEWIIICSILFSLSIIYTACYLLGIIEFHLFLLEFLTPVLIFSGAIFLSFLIQLWKSNIYFLMLICLSTLSISVFSVHKNYKGGFVETDENRVQKTLDNLKGAERFLDSLGVPKTAKISLINGYGGNMSLMKTGRVGYVADGVEIEDIKRVLNHKDSKYILSQDQFFMFDVVNVYPEVLSQIQLIYSNETLSLYKKREKYSKSKGQILLDYVNSHNKKEYYEVLQNFEKNDNHDTIGTWKINGEVLNDSGFFSQKSLFIDERNEFPCTYSVKVNKLKNKPKGVVITGMFYSSQELRKVCFNTSCHSVNPKDQTDETQYFIEQFKVSKKIKGNLNSWQRISCKVSLPEQLQDTDVIKIYIWNPHNGSLVMDDFSFIFY
jgi:hypothetical protein